VLECVIGQSGDLWYRDLKRRDKHLSVIWLSRLSCVLVLYYFITSANLQSLIFNMFINALEKEVSNDQVIT